jgi:hypothetical protein
VKVRYDKCYYYIFWLDLPSATTPADQTATSGEQIGCGGR